MLLTVRQESIYLTSSCGFSENSVHREVKRDSNYIECES